MMYQSIKLSNGIWGLVEIKLTPGSPSITLFLKSRVTKRYIIHVLVYVLFNYLYSFRLVTMTFSSFFYFFYKSCSVLHNLFSQWGLLCNLNINPSEIW